MTQLQPVLISPGNPVGTVTRVNEQANGQKKGKP
jgi:hypothetical protein